ncbi:MAG: class I SAM-dependent methyltransferase, partial [Thermoplasmata archaeon]
MTPRGAPQGMRREFDLEAHRYDRTARASMPGYSDLHRTLIWGIPFVPTRSFRLLELGVGTGTLTAQILDTFPQAQVTGIDLSPRMISHARAKLRPHRDRVELIAGDLGAFKEGTYEVVVSALAIHHLRDADKWRLFRRVYRSLPSGGYFGDADDHLPEDSIFDTRYAQVASLLSTPGRRSGGWTSPQAVWHGHEKFDHPSTLTAELGALERAG